MSPVRIVTDNTENLLRNITKLTNTETVVGITGSTNPRSDSSFGNASIAFIAEFGSPAANIPMRPIFGPGLDKVRKQLFGLLKNAGIAAAEGRMSDMASQFEAIGLVAQQSIQQVITDGQFVPLAISTIRARARRTSSDQGTVGAKEFLKIMKGTLPESKW